VVFGRTQDTGPASPAGGHRTQENASAVAYVVEARLKVMLESDYLAADKQGAGSREQGEMERQHLRLRAPCPLPHALS